MSLSYEFALDGIVCYHYLLRLCHYSQEGFRALTVNLQPRGLLCLKCSEVNPATATTCATCGQPLVITCHRCGTTRPIAAPACPKCQPSAGEADALVQFVRPAPPKVLKNRYVVGQQISLGRVAAVYLARDRQDPGRLLVLKELSDMMLLGRDERQQAARSFARRAEQWLGLEHPNLVRLVDFFSHGRNCYLVTEFIPGTSLDDIIPDSTQPLTEDLVRGWAVQLCDALAYLHGQDPPIIFADLKPGHVLVSDGGVVKLVDFNLTRLFEPWRRVDPTRAGTPGYAAPEQARGLLSPQSDIYALGRVLYAALTRRRLDKVTGGLPPLTKVVPGLSRRLAAIIEQAIQDNPGARFASAEEMRAALLSLGHVPEPIPLPPRLAPYYFADGRVASDLAELTGLALADWDEALRQFYDGSIADWLRERAEALSQGLETPLSARLNRLARKANRIRQEMQMASELERQQAFYEWLKAAGHIEGSPELEVEPTQLELGAVAPNRRRVIRLRVRNAGEGYLLGEVESRAPWVEATTGIFGCGPGEEAQVVIKVRGSRLQRTTRGSSHAVVLNSNGGRARIGIQVTLAGEPAPVAKKPVGKPKPRPTPAPAPRLELAEEVLDFGPVEGDTPVVRELVIRNRGGGRLTGRVLSRHPWLTVAQAAFICPAQGEVRMAVRLDPARLEPGTHVQREAILVDSDFGQAHVEVRVTRVKPVLELNPRGLDFGGTPRGEDAHLQLRITNAGSGTLTADLRPQVPWLMASPTQVSCAGGKSVTCQVVAHTGEMPAGLTQVPDALLVTTNAGEVSLPARIEVLVPQLRLETSVLDFGTVAPQARPQKAVILRNTGTAPARVTLTPEAPNLMVRPSELVIKPGKEARAQVRLSGLEEDWAERPALRMRWSGGEGLVRVTARLAVPRLVVTPDAGLDFGYVERGAAAEAQLTINNPGGDVLNWQVELGDEWLEVVPRTGTCGPGEAATLVVRGYALALPAEAQEGETWLVVTSDVGRVQLPVRLGVAIPRLALEVLELDFGTSVNYEPVTQTLRVFNRGLGRLEGRVPSLVGWVRVEPGQFECGTGASCAIQVTALPAGLQPGRTVKTAALRVESNGGDVDLDARIVLVLEPRLEVSPSVLEFVAPKAGESASELLLINTGYAPLEAELRPGHPALSLSRTSCVVKPQKSVEVEATLDLGCMREAPLERLGVEVEGAGDIVWVPVKVRPGIDPPS